MIPYGGSLHKKMTFSKDIKGMRKQLMLTPRERTFHSRPVGKPG